MRIVAGRFRGRRLAAPAGLAVRPTAERTREALFDVLARGGSDSLDDMEVLDAFAGTGALGLEALSRGARQVTFMESQATALAALKTNVDKLAVGDLCRVVKADVLRPPRAGSAVGLVLMDPPYGQGLAEPALSALVEAGWIDHASLTVVELMAKEPFDPPAGFSQSDQRKYGQARLVFLRRDS